MSQYVKQLFESIPGRDDEVKRQPEPRDKLIPDPEIENELRLIANQGEDETILTSYRDGETPPPFQGPSGFQIRHPQPPLNSSGNDAGDSNNQSVERHTPDRGYPLEPYTNIGNQEYADPSPDTTFGSSHQSGERHDREHGTDHSRNSRSDQSHPERQALPPGRQNSPGSQGSSWTYERIRFGVTETLFEYKYDEYGRLITEEGYENNIIQYYLANHDLYIGRDIKDCGLTLWIQRAPRTADYRGGAAGGLCLYRGCSVSEDRSIKPGDVRVAFDDSYARTPEHDPQANAAYVHLECLEKSMPEDLREMYARLNFKVEERGPHPDDPLHRNPTIFNTMQEILYVEKYLEQCRREFREDSDHRSTRQTCYSGPLSAGIEKQRNSQYEVVRDLQRKLLELGGSQAWYKLNTVIERQYVDAGGPGQTVSPRINPKTTGTRSDPSWEEPQWAGSNEYDLDAEEPQPVLNQEHDTDDDTIPDDPYAASQSDSSVRVVPPARPILTKPLPSKPERLRKKGKGKEIVPPYKGRGKIKQRLFIDDRGGEVWERFEDPFSDAGGDHEPYRRTRKSRNDNGQFTEANAGVPDLGRQTKRPGVDLNDGVEVEDKVDRQGTKKRRGAEATGQKSRRGRPRKR